MPEQLRVATVSMVMVSDLRYDWGAVFTVELLGMFT